MSGILILIAALLLGCALVAGVGRRQPRRREPTAIDASWLRGLP